MIKIKIIVIILLTLASAGCATLKTTDYYKPVKPEGWTEASIKNGFLEFGEIPPDVKYKCGDTSITLQSASRVTVILIGIPFIPFFPICCGEIENNSATLIVKCENNSNKIKVQNAVVLIKNDKKLEPVETIAYEDKTKSLSYFGYKYQLSWDDIKSFTFQIDTNDSKCGIVSVPFLYDSHVTYSMLGF